MSKLTQDNVVALAALSRLTLTSDEIDKFRGELSGILDYVEALNDVNEQEAEPTYQVTGLKNVMRPDEIKDYGYRVQELLKNAPATKTGQFKVKRVIG